MKTAAIMQPYIFPYIGYFRLINEADIFICLDDVNFIKKGWIHRNKLLCNGEPTWFTIPIKNASQNVYIQETLVCSNQFEKWRKSFFNTLKHFYKKAPYYTTAYQAAESVFLGETQTISEMALKSIQVCCSLFNITTQIIPSSSIFHLDHLKGESRIIEICKAVSAKRYLNLSGGKDLYTQESFDNNKIELNFLADENSFLKPKSQDYSVSEFTPFICILDMIARYGVETIKNHLKQ